MGEAEAFKAGFMKAWEVYSQSLSDSKITDRIHATRYPPTHNKIIEYFAQWITTR